MAPALTLPLPQILLLLLAATSARLPWKRAICRAITEFARLSRLRAHCRAGAALLSALPLPAQTFPGTLHLRIIMNEDSVNALLTYDDRR